MRLLLERDNDEGMTSLRDTINRLMNPEKWGMAKKHMKPSFLIIGAPKAGTTALFDYLSKHPGIAAPEIKELDFFNCKSRYGKGTDFYHSHFPLVDKNEGKITFEASVSYLANTDAPERIYRYNPEIKLIALLREPVERAYSTWNMFNKYYKSDRDWFTKWMRRCDENYQPGVMKARALERFDSFDYVVNEEIEALREGKEIESPVLRQGRYSEQFERYFTYFAKSQIQVFENNAFLLNTAGVLKEIEKFLNIPAHDWSKEDISPVFKGEYEEGMPEDIRAFLKEYYRPYNEKIFRLLGTRYDW